MGKVKVFETNSGNPKHEVIDLSAICAGKTNAKIRFQWEGNGAGFWAIDNVKIFAPLYLDAGITNIDSPEMPFKSGTEIVKITLANNGYASLTSVIINWSVNDVTQPSYKWLGSLPNGTSIADIPIGNFPFKPGFPAKIKIWSDFPNGNSDLNHFNDTITKILYARLCGTYTIGGSNPNFRSFNEAVSVLTDAGITCPVVFKVRDGNYPEQVEINPVPGSSRVNTVTFESESGDSSKVVVSNPSTGKATITLNGAKNMIIRKVGILMNGYGASSMSIENGSENILVENCDMSNTWYALGVWIGGGSREVTLRRNYMHEGYGNYRVGIDHAEDVRIESNIMKVNWESAIYASSGVNNLVIIDNDIYESGSPGINLNLSTDSAYVYGNRIRNGSINVTSTSENGWCAIENNRILTSTSSGIVLNTKKCLVANNYITLRGINPFYGIQSTNSSNTKIVFNSILIQNIHMGSACILIDGGTSLEIRNNIFSNPGGGYSAYIASLPTSGVWDYNRVC